ncbi:hypothetical protein FGW37_00765 [Streptomyces rectiverticillatus]|uniref:hypothetical protein n=1 Tax=Streptomyces rectiverticillatus TaxID=173860 RepID=UPI0015C338E9|nr:hypothetical protein FGW37_00765 [Streptomyces rectiverticillatus]
MSAGPGCRRSSGATWAVRVEPGQSGMRSRASGLPTAREVPGTDAPDVVVLASAGRNRLGLRHAISEHLPLGTYLPSPGQGALGIQVRENGEAAGRAVGRLERCAERPGPTRAAWP